MRMKRTQVHVGANEGTKTFTRTRSLSRVSNSEKLKTSRIAGYKDFEEELTNKRSLSRVSKVSKYETDEIVGRSRKDVRKKSKQ
ncbi:hypothetical protein RND71_025363 [Anisodus tanguticus]|uniref:Uncharacterized protein n=1 Tax=Anisodus tanguticus TaxID=243964 RepID=A0AAE1V5Q7_9SOLA|nr:hypothetical protein RND71_025363 [Anisodus tanguticus]